MKFSEKLIANKRLSIPITPKPIFEYSHQFVLLGSCFSSEMNNKLSALFIQSYSNPFGTLFAPTALEKMTSILVGTEKENLFFSDGYTHCLDFGSDFKSKDVSILESQINALKMETLSKIKSADHIILTLGSAFVYRHLESEQFVGNCHKLPGHTFEKTLLTPMQIEQSCEQITKNLTRLNPNLHISFTISPVRHLRDGIIENGLSKAHLKVGLNTFLNRHTEYTYFPAFEIFNEELRDQEYFNHDLAHPNDWSTEYIFYRWIESFGTPGFLKYVEAAQKLRKTLDHRPKSNDSESLELWDSTVSRLRLEFLERYPEVGFELIKISEKKGIRDFN